MDERDREALSLDFDGEIGNMRCTLAERIPLHQHLVIAVSLWSRCVVGIVVVGRYKEKLQGNWLYVYM
jgi:hypothetical protein